MIIDTHAHVWPYPGRDEHGTVEERMRFQQRHMLWHMQGIRRLSDQELVNRRTLHDGTGSGLTNMFDVNFRPGDHGRLVWTYEGEDYYVQWMPAALQGFEAPAELMIAQMDGLGVDLGVISRAHIYGRLNDLVADAVNQFPGRFIGAAEIDEWRAHEDSQMAELNRCVEDLGMRTLYFDGTESFFMVDYKTYYDQPQFVGFWQQVARLELPVLWHLRCRNELSPADFANELQIFRAFVEKWSNINFVFTHCFEMNHFENGRLSSLALEICRLPNIHLELLFPIMNGGSWEYPYPQAQEIIKQLYAEIGADKMMWGSDMPAVERVCTYRQSLDYLRCHCDFIAPDDMGKILGGNAMKLFGID